VEIVGANPILTIRDTDTSGSTANSRIRFAESGASDSLDQYWDVGLDPTLALVFSRIGTEHARFDLNGNLLVGKTATTFSTEGIVAFSSADSNGSRINITNDGGETLNLNRKTSDGNIAIFYKDGTTVGSIGNTGTDLYIGTGDVGLSFYDYSTENAILPHNPGTNSAADASIDLGRGTSGSERRFKDLYLSGTANVGANITLSANDSYVGFPSNGIYYNNSADHISVKTAGAERMRITSSGTMGFGMQPLGTNSGSAFFDGNVSSKDGFMTTAGDLTLLQPSAGDTIFVRDNGNETMRISSAGDFVYATTGTTGSELSNGGICFRDNGSQVYGQFASGTTSNVTFIYFYTKSGTGIAHIGSISHTGSTMSYGSASDYRLKENVVSLDSALSRVNQLQPKRFNFIADGDDTTVDGFIAHEVKEIVPEAITGEKDAVDDEGNPEYQTIDQSKLVPLLTKAIQEQQTIIDDLKTRIETLENV